MEKKFKVSDFADLVGCTPKTVYKMIERNELFTVTEKVNHRETTLISANEARIKELQVQFGKITVSEQNCNEFVTYIEGNEPVKNTNTNEIIEKVIDITREYTEQIKTYNDELITYKSQVLLLEDKQKTEKASLEHWQQEYYQKDTELKTVQKSKTMIIISLVIVIVVLLLLLLTVCLLLGFEKSKGNNDKILTNKDTVIEQQLPVSEPKPKTQPQKKVTQKK